MTVVKPFPQFGVVSDFSDHHYAKSKIKTSAAVTTKIKEEWEDLEKHLPDSIFVRAYQDRINMLRAVIIGAKGTPYHDGLYFFDISFPSDYPARPPLLHYRSFGLQINPDLHANGKVCLKLANTWPVRNATEEWNPKSSTVLQVLLSIQALVLNAKPYFNRPGREIYTGWNAWEGESNDYNESVSVLSLKTMAYLLRKPPKNFEAFVVSHFKERAAAISAACRAYANGSAHFRYTMAEQYANFVSGLKRCEAQMENFEKLNAQRRTTSLVDSKPETKKKIGIGRRVWGNLKKVLGLKSEKENVQRT